MNREAWLQAALVLVRQHLQDTAQSVVPDNVRVSCGFPGGRGGSNKKAIGQCWPSQLSADTSTEIFISPTQANPLTVLAILVHEAIHAAVGCEHGHKAPFAKVAKAAGLEGKMTATVAGERLNAIMNGWLDTLGIYPHATLSPSDGKGKQSTRLLKCECASCGYTVRVTKKWLDFSGAPYCPTDACRDEDDSPARMSVDTGESDE
jgi:hypothetical protein